LNNTITESESGILAIGAQGARITGNTVDLSGTEFSEGSWVGYGIFCFMGSGLNVERNVVRHARLGIFLFFCGGDLLRNESTDNLFTGIARDRSNGLTENNRAHRNGGSGIDAYDSHGLIINNVTNDNDGSGVTVGDSITTHGPLYTVTGNVANGNGGYGMRTHLDGVISGTKNRAHDNGASGQCHLIVCN
jgi:hypothetical protein